MLGEQAELKGKGDQALLRTVVQIPFQATAFVLLGFHHAGTRAVHFLQPRAQLGFQPAVLQRNSGCRADRLDQLGLVAQRWVVHQRGKLFPVLPDDGDAAITVGLRERRRIAVRIRPAAVLRQPVDQARAWGREAPGPGARPEVGRGIRAQSDEQLATPALARRASRRPARKAIGASPTTAKVASRMTSKPGKPKVPATSRTASMTNERRTSRSAAGRVGAAATVAAATSEPEQHNADEASALRPTSCTSWTTSARFGCRDGDQVVAAEAAELRSTTLEAQRGDIPHDHYDSLGRPASRPAG